MTIKIYSLKTCPYCDYIEEQVRGNPKFQLIDIGKHVHNMAEFIHLRDTDPEFDRMKKMGDIGIPCFVLPNGKVTLKPEDVGLIEYGSAAACSRDGKGC